MNSLYKNKHAWIFIVVAVCGVTAIGFFLSTGEPDVRTDAAAVAEREGELEAGDKADGPEESVAESADSTSSESRIGVGAVGADTSGSPEKQDLSNASVSGGASLSQKEGSIAGGSVAVKGGAESDAAAETAEAEEQLPACVVASFEAEENILRKSQVLELPKELKGQSFCLLVDNKPIKATPIEANTKKGQTPESLSMDWVPSRKSAKVEMIFCRKKSDCPLKCQKPEEDFWDELDVETVANSEEGFLAEETAQEVQLSKELAKLKTLLSQKNKKQELAIWKVASREPAECETSKLGGR